MVQAEIVEALKTSNRNSIEMLILIAGFMFTVKGEYPLNLD